jgi:hypothetical protein
MAVDQLEGEAMSDRLKAVFLVGCPRSGTTLIQSLLGCAPGFATFPESHLFSRGFARRLGLALPQRSAKKEALRFFADAGISSDRLPPAGPLTLLPGLRGVFFLDVLDAAARAENAHSWLEKTPRHLHYIDVIQAAVRAAHRQVAFVHVVRDGVAVASSLIKASQYWHRQRAVAESLARWQKDLAISRRYLGQPGHHFIVYEDFIAGPEAHALKLAGQIELALTIKDLERRNEIRAKVTKRNEVWKLDTAMEEIRPLARVAIHVDSETQRLMESQIDRADYWAVRAAAARSPADRVQA